MPRSYRITIGYGLLIVRVALAGTVILLAIQQEIEFLELSSLSSTTSKRWR